MTRPADRDRIIWFLSEQGGTSNQQVKASLGLTDQRYKEIVNTLIEADIVEKYRCRGGGIRLSKNGRREKTLAESGSAVESEKQLYGPFLKALEKEIYENEENAVIINTSSLRMRGKWSNPDLIKISLRHYPLQKKHDIVLTTYEVKQWGKWNVEAVFEAASHRRYAHESYVVLEWAKEHPVEGTEQIETVCSRFGVGLMTLHPYYQGFRFVARILADGHSPSDGDVEEYLEYVLQKGKKAREAYESLWASRQEIYGESGEWQ